jgi:hypothetical protein
VIDTANRSAGAPQDADRHRLRDRTSNGGALLQ